MSTLTARLPIQLTQTIDNLFSLHIIQDDRHAVITMQVFTPIVNTVHLPLTHTILKKCLPSVLKSQCFNEENLPFSAEVRQTEIGHLLEHVLLEYLCQFRLASGEQEAMFRGNTSWNWRKDPVGTFHITVSAGRKDADIFALALSQTIELVKLIMRNYTMKEMQNMNTFSYFTEKHYNLEEQSPFIPYLEEVSADLLRQH